jgi:hypothetical protein
MFFLLLIVFSVAIYRQGNPVPGAENGRRRWGTDVRRMGFASLNPSYDTRGGAEPEDVYGACDGETVIAQRLQPTAIDKKGHGTASSVSRGPCSCGAVRAVRLGAFAPYLDRVASMSRRIHIGKMKIFRHILYAEA